MTNAINATKTAFTWSVVALTILWSVGVSALAPLAVQAAEYGPGDLLSPTDSSAVYIINDNMERVFFANGRDFASYPGLGSVAQVDPSVFADFANGGGTTISYGPVQDQLSRDVYFVNLDGETYRLASEEAANALLPGWFGLRAVIGGPFVSYYPNSLNSASAGDADGVSIMPRSVVFYSDSYWVEMDGALYPVDGELSAFLMARATPATAAMVAGFEIMTDTVTSATVVDATARAAGNGSSTTPTTPTTPTPVVGGDVAVSLSANTPVSGNVVASVDGVVFTKVILTAGSNDATVNSVKIGRTGLGATSDFASVTLYDGVTKLGSTRTSWHSDGYMTYNISGGWVIPAGTSKELTISANVTGTNTFNALGVLDLGLANDGDVSGEPVYGNQMTAVSVTVGTATITAAGSDSTKKIGTTDVDLTKFKITMSSIEDARLLSVTLKNKGTAADDNLANMTLWDGTTQLAGAVSMVSDKITFELDEPFLIEKSKNDTLTVKGDIVNGDANTVIFIVDSSTDVHMVGDTYNSRVSVSSTQFDVAGEGTTITIDGAELNVALTSVAMDTADDVTDVELGRITLGAGSTDIKITDMSLTIDETDGDSDGFVMDIDEFEMVDAVSGAAYSGSVTSGAGDAAITDVVWNFTDEIYLTAGESLTLIVRGDIPASSTVDSDAYNVVLTTSNITAETVPAGDAISNYSVGTVTGKKVTVKRPTMTIKATTLNEGTAVVNESGVVLFEGTMKATAGDARFESLTFNSTTANGLAAMNFTDIGLYVGGALQQNVTNSSLTSGTVDFDSLDFTVASGDTVTFQVLANIAGTVSTTPGNVAQIRLGANTVKDVDNDDVSVVDAGGTAISTSNYLTTSRVVTVNDKGILYVQMRNNDTGINKDRVVLAGEGEWVGNLRLRADYEDVLLKDLKLTNPNANAEDSVESVCLYQDAMTVSAETLVGCTTVDSSDIAFFDDVNFTVEAGTTDLFVYVMTNNMGKAATATADSQDVIAFSVVTTTGHLTAQGVDSGEELTYALADGSTPAAGEIAFDKDLDGNFSEASGDDGGTATTKAFYVAGTMITNVELVSSYGGESLGTTISDGDTVTVAILKVTAATHSNADANGTALKAGIDNFLFDMTKYATTTISGATIERLNGDTAAAALTVTASTTGGAPADIADDWTMTSVTSTLGQDAFLDSGETAYFIVKATISGVSTVSNTQNWIRVGLDDLKGSVGDANNNIDWFDGYDTNYATASNFDYLFLDTTSIEGARIAGPLNN